MKSHSYWWIRRLAVAVSLLAASLGWVETRQASAVSATFNLLNSATPTGADFSSGPTFGYATGVVPPLITRLGARFTF